MPKALPPAKPFLVILLPDLIDQFCNEVRDFSKELQPLVYYGDERKKTNVHNRLEETLTRHHPLFNGDEKNYGKLVVTSLPTLVTRHGPSAQEKWRLSQKNATKGSDELKALYDVLDPEWKHCLRGCFETGFIDEAHVVKNADSASHILVRWLLLMFLFLATATILPNHVSDFAGYVAFIEPSKNLWTKEQFSAWGKAYTDDFNPYVLPDDDPASALQMTGKAITRWITGPRADKANAGFYLGKVWERCVIRRTYAWPNPQFPEKIGESIAKLYSRRIVCEFTKDEQTQYGTAFLPHQNAN